VITDAHRQSIELLAWHPAGHLLASASHDCMLKFWCREPPGSKLEPAASEQMENPPVVHYGPLGKESIEAIRARAIAQAAAAQANRAQQMAQPAPSVPNRPPMYTHNARKRPREY
jgi:hypothetical protein